MLKRIRRVPFGLLLIIILALFFRLIWLDRVPNGITDDELIFVLNAKAVFFTGSDISGAWNPLTFAPIPGITPMAELPSLIMAPFTGLLPLSLFTSKLPYALVSTLLAVLLYLITSKLLGRREAFFVGIVAALNPWSIFTGRTAYDAPLAIFFYLLAFLMLLYAKNWKILLVFIPLFFGFYSYIATKVIFIPFTLLIVSFSWLIWNKKKFSKQYLVLLLLCLALFIFFLTSLKFNSTKERLSEISTPNDPKYAKTVDTERQLSMKSPLRDVFSNKVVVFGKDSIDKYLKVFSTEFLFLKGEGTSTLSLGNHGYFYYLDFIFIIVGFCVLFKRNRPIWFFISGLILIAPLPAVANNLQTGSWVLRSSLLYPMFIFLIGIGIWFIVFLFKRKIFQGLILSALVILYTAGVLNFVNIFFFRNPFYNSESFSLSSRVVSNYIQFAGKDGRKVIVTTNDPKKSFYQYMFNTNQYNRKNASKIRDLVREEKYEYKNAVFTGCLSNLKFSKETIYIGGATSKCGQIDFKYNRQYLNIPRLSDGGPIYTIVNDSICGKYHLNLFPTDILVSDFAINDLPEKRFCKQFITISQ